MYIDSLLNPRCTSIKQECGMAWRSETGFHGRFVESVLLLTRHTSEACGNPNVEFLSRAVPTICSKCHPRATEQSMPGLESIKRENQCNAHHIMQDTAYISTWIEQYKIKTKKKNHCTVSHYTADNSCLADYFSSLYTPFDYQSGSVSRTTAVC